MNYKIVVGSIFAVLLMLSMPMITNINAKTLNEKIVRNDCNICPLKKKFGFNLCKMITDGIEDGTWLDTLKNAKRLTGKIVGIVIGISALIQGGICYILHPRLIID